MSQYIDIRIQSGELKRIMAGIKSSLVPAMKQAVGVVKAKVVDLTPRWKGGLARSIESSVSPDGREGVVRTEGVVARVMEANPPAKWSKPPPWQAIHDWVEGKLGLSGKEANRMTAGVRRNILRRGIPIPLVADGRGAMFKRTFEIMRSTRFHMDAFARSLRQIK